MMERRERGAAAGSVPEPRDQRVPGEPAVERVPQAAFALPVDDADGAFAAHEGALHDGFRRRAGLVPAQAVQIGLRHVAARFGQEQQAFERVGAWSWRHRFSSSAFRKWAR